MGRLSDYLVRLTLNTVYVCPIGMVVDSAAVWACSAVVNLAAR